MEYAREVRDLSATLGTSAEETSRMIQVLDDFQITGDQLSVALRTLRQEGLAPSIDVLANLSDEFLRLNPGIERTNFLMSHFGRQGVQFATVMQQGGAAIRERSAAVQQSLILDEAAIRRTEAFRLAVDDLNDEAQGLATTIGLAVIPALTRLIENLQGAEDAAGTTAAEVAHMGSEARRLHDLAAAGRDAAGGLLETERAARASASAVSGIAGAADTATGELRLLSDEMLTSMLAADSQSRVVSTAADAIDRLRSRHIVITIETIRREAQFLLRAGQAGATGMAGFQHGGSFIVGGPSGTDRSLVAFPATRGERVIVQTPEQQRGGAGRSLSIGQLVINSGLDQQAFNKMAENWLRA
jgi:hypothetical protein